MENYTEKQLKKIRENPKIKGALEVFERAQKVYYKSMQAMTPKYNPKFKGSYSSSIKIYENSKGVFLVKNVPFQVVPMQQIP